MNGSRARNFPLIAYARSIKDAGGKPLFTGVTEIHEPESLIPRPAAGPAPAPATAPAGVAPKAPEKQ